MKHGSSASSGNTREKEEADAKAKADAEAREKEEAEAEAREKEEAEARAKDEAGAKAKAEAEAREKEDAAARARPVKLTVTAKSPLWRGVPGAWVKHWPQGETLVEAEELSMFAPEIVDAMIAALEGDALGNFTVAIERARIES